MRAKPSLWQQQHAPVRIASATLGLLLLTKQPIHAIKIRRINTPAAISLYRLLGVCAYGLIATLTARNDDMVGHPHPNGIIHNSHKVRISLLAQAKNITCALRKYHCVFGAISLQKKSHTQTSVRLFLFLSYYASVIAPTGQPSSHAPQSMH